MLLKPASTKLDSRAAQKQATPRNRFSLLRPPSLTTRQIGATRSQARIPSFKNALIASAVKLRTVETHKKKGRNFQVIHCQPRSRPRQPNLANSALPLHRTSLGKHAILPRCRPSSTTTQITLPWEAASTRIVPPAEFPLPAERRQPRIRLCQFSG
jgi:hypothetical protein